MSQSAFKLKIWPEPLPAPKKSIEREALLNSFRDDLEQGQDIALSSEQLTYIEQVDPERLRESVRAAYVTFNEKLSDEKDETIFATNLERASAHADLDLLVHSFIKRTRDYVGDTGLLDSFREFFIATREIMSQRFDTSDKTFLFKYFFSKFNKLKQALEEKGQCLYVGIALDARTLLKQLAKYLHGFDKKPTKRDIGIVDNFAWFLREVNKLITTTGIVVHWPKPTINVDCDWKVIRRIKSPRDKQCT